MAAVTRQKSETYQALIDVFPLVPLKSKKELKEASAMLDALLGKELDSGEEDYFEVLSQLVETYEDKHEEIPSPSLSGLLDFLMESHSVSAVQITCKTGIAASTISEIRHGKRLCSRENCKKLAEFFNVSPTLFFEAMMSTDSEDAHGVQKSTRPVKRAAKQKPSNVLSRKIAT